MASSFWSRKSWLPSARFAGLLEIELTDFDDLLYPFYELHCGQVIASAKETLTVDSANAGIALTLGIDEGKPIVVIEELALSVLIANHWSGAAHVGLPTPSAIRSTSVEGCLRRKHRVRRRPQPDASRSGYPSGFFPVLQGGIKPPLAPDRGPP